MSKPRPAAITVSEWLTELERLQAKGDDAGQTTGEMCEASGLHLNRINAVLHEAHRQGRLRVTRKAITTLDGRRSTVPAYTILPAN